MHLHVVCTDPCKNELQLIVSITGWTNNLCDSSCVLEVGDHTWLTKKSWVIYRKARTELAATLASGVDRGLFIPKDPMVDGVFERVCGGILSSPHTPRGMKKYYKQQM